MLGQRAPTRNSFVLNILTSKVSCPQDLADTFANPAPASLSKSKGEGGYLQITKSVQKPSLSGATENDTLYELFSAEIHRRETRR
jgi:hypothetical protein